MDYGSRCSVDETDKIVAETSSRAIKEEIASYDAALELLIFNGSGKRFL